MTNIPKSVFGRTSRLLLSGARIATAELAGRVAAKLGENDATAGLAVKVKQTRDLVQTLSQLKGAAMKAGQMLGVELSDLMPPEVVDVLRELHDSSTFMEYPQVRAILERELGKERLAELKGFTEQPIAAASIGQVHRAELNGKSVVVKVQFPGVADTIDSDLTVLRRTIALFLQMQGKEIALDGAFEELARVLKQETDYLQEAQHANAYRAMLNGDRFVVPEVFVSHSTNRVLTMSYESGAKLNDWMKAGPGPKAVAHFANSIIELLIQEFFVGGLVQTDPNYGNFLYRPVDQRLVLLDFGAVNPYPAAFRDEIRTLLSATADGDEQKVLDLTFQYKLMDPRESPATQALYLELMRQVGRMFGSKSQPFHFAAPGFLNDLRTSAMEFVQGVRFSGPARQVIFLNRKLGGMFHLLKDADASVDMHAYLERVKALEL